MTPEEYQEYWQEIVNAGGPESYIDRELRASGAYRYQRKTAKECFKLFKGGTEKQQQDYIKGARAEQKERSRIRSFVWEVYTNTHINHLGNDIFWSDFFDDDFFDPYNRHKRIEEQELPSIETLDEVISFLHCMYNSCKFLSGSGMFSVFGDRGPGGRGAFTNRR